MSTPIDVARAQRLLRRRAQLVDALPPTVFADEHLPGAVNIPLETLDADAVAELDRRRPVIVYCADQH
ncbi:MAG: rhodanese-like domain-containing protein [Acidimicrobiia bacterium]|nr:rhodanese-like domain-containing protein [Acidimicrobiia bacterium]